MDILRITRILVAPRVVWHEIKEDRDTFGHVLTHYLLPLAAIPAVFAFFGHVFVGMPSSYRYIVYRAPFGLAFLRMLIYYVLLVAGFYVQGIIINALAASFHARQDATNAFKLAVFSCVPAFIAGILYCVPVLSALVLFISLYSIYILYRGVPIMMAVPKEKVGGYTISIVVVMIVIWVIVNGICGVVLAPAWHS